MAIQNRNTTLPGIWASTAQTTIPTPPVAGVTYRDTTLNSTAIDKAWPFKTIVDSSDFNQHAFLQDTLIKEAEQYGVMRWNNTTAYKKGGFCLAQDEKVYQAKRDNQGKDPTSNPDDWKIPFAIDADIVHKTGDETINGRKTFNGSGIGIIKSGSAIDIQNKAVDLSVTDGSVSGTTEIHFIDKNGIVQGIVEHQNRTNGDTVMIMAVRNHANTYWKSIDLGFTENDNFFTNVHTPPSSSNNTNIATTSWVRTSTAGIPNYAAGVAITATGTYTTPSKGVLIGTPINNNSAEALKISIDNKTFYFCPGNSGEDNNHMSQCYLPMNKGQSYKVIELNGNVQLYFFPFL